MELTKIKDGDIYTGDKIGGRIMVMGRAAHTNRHVLGSDGKAFWLGVKVTYVIVEEQLMILEYIGTRHPTSGSGLKLPVWKIINMEEENENISNDIAVDSVSV